MDTPRMIELENTGWIIMTAVNYKTGEATSETYKLLSANEDAEGNGYFRVEYDGAIYELTQKRVG